MNIRSWEGVERSKWKISLENKHSYRGQNFCDCVLKLRKAMPPLQSPQPATIFLRRVRTLIATIRQTIATIRQLLPITIELMWCIHQFLRKGMRMVGWGCVMPRRLTPRQPPRATGLESHSQPPPQPHLPPRKWLHPLHSHIQTKSLLTLRPPAPCLQLPLLPQFRSQPHPPIRVPPPPPHYHLPIHLPLHPPFILFQAVHSWGLQIYRGCHGLLSK